MKYYYKYDNGIEIQIWEDEIPNQQTQLVNFIHKEYSGKIPILNKNKKLAVEFLLPKNISNYAMLGLIYEANNILQTEIKIDISDYEEGEFENNIAMKPDYIHKGIPEDYVEGIEESIANINERNLLPKGSYEFCVGAHGEVGSSEMSFMLTCNILLNLLSITEYTEEKVKEIIQNEIINIKNK
ncbi:MAG: hypothetical protein ACERKZ_21920 [Lachnotalea sp.]